MGKPYGLSWISERVHLDSLDDEPWQRLKALADEEGMSMGDYVVQYGPDGHIYTFSDAKGEVQLDAKTRLPTTERNHMHRIIDTIHGWLTTPAVDAFMLKMERRFIAPLAPDLLTEAHARGYDVGYADARMAAVAVVKVAFTEDDVRELAKELGVDEDVALDRANSWSDQITQMGFELVFDGVSHAIKNDSLR